MSGSGYLLEIITEGAEVRAAHRLSSWPPEVSWNGHELQVIEEGSMVPDALAHARANRKPLPKLDVAAPAKTLGDYPLQFKRKESASVLRTIPRDPYAELLFGSRQ